MPRGLVLILILSSFNTSPAMSEPSLDRLMKACDQKTIVMNSSGDRIGEHIDGYCSGFVEGAFTLLRERRAICDKDDPDRVSPEFLISVINQYRADNSSETNVGTLIDKAFVRAFPC